MTLFLILICIVGYCVVWLAFSMLNVVESKHSGDPPDYSTFTFLGLFWPFTLPIFILIHIYDAMKWLVTKLSGGD